MLSYTIMIIEVKTKAFLSDFLRSINKAMATDCTLHKGCGKCRVRLLSGIWESGGKTLSAPADAVACITRLRGVTGTIEIPEKIPVSNQILREWQTPSPLPFSEFPLIAVDMGTTTLAAVRIEKGRIVKSASTFNGQLPFGDNVIARIAAAESRFSDLRRALLCSIGALLEEVDFQSAYRIGVAGNTVMNCFLHGISPRSIGTYPFKAPQLIFPERNDLWGDLPVVTVPSLTGLIGGDITGALFESPLEEGELLLDLGTNCEMVFCSASGLYGTSAAAGPAFEGAGISCGSRAVEGAIDRYTPQGFRVIGDTRPRSLCGSGLVDFLAVEHAKGTLNRFGRFTSGAKRFDIAPGVSVTEADIAELLKAKAAVSAAISSLERCCGEKVRKLKLAGGFSQYLDLDSARGIGLLPPLPATVCGNLSLAGAARCAAAPETLPLMGETAKKIREIHLNDVPGFEEDFLAALLLL